MKKLYKVFILTFISLSYLIITPNNIFAEQFGFSDDFNDGNSEGWLEVAPWGSWTVQNGEYRGTVTLNSQPERPSYSIRGDRAWEDYTFSVDIKGEQGVDKDILVRVDENNRGYAIVMRREFFSGGDDIVLVKRNLIGSAEGTLMTSVPFDNTQGVTYSMKVTVKNVETGVNIIVNVDDVEMLNYVDTINYIDHGAVGFEVWPGGYQLPVQGLVTTTRYDNVLVQSLDNGDILLSVPDLKQTQSPWGTVVYNNYPDTATSETIGKWGCALTAATMILNKHNHTITPDQLNTWLKQNNGYDPSHGIKFPFVAAYATANEDQNANRPGLEFSRSTYTPEKLDTEIQNSKPAIVEVPHPLSPSGVHFIVAKGKTSSDILINDPGSTKTLLSQHSTPLGLRLFEPAFTDSSYLLIYLDSDVAIKVFDPNNNEVLDSYYIQPPIADNDAGTLSGSPIGVFSIAKPMVGQYKVELSGNTGSYTLESDLINPTGGITVNTFNGILNSNQTDELKINIGDTNSTQQIITIDSVIADVDAAYSQNLITNKKVYQLIKGELLLAKFWKNLNKTTLYKGTLKVALYDIRKFTPKYMTQEISDILQSNINYLLTH